MLYKIKDHPNFSRDINSMAVVNTDRSAISRDIQYKNRKKKDEEVSEEINNIKNTIHDIRCDLKRIIDFLHIKGN